MLISGKLQKKLRKNKLNQTKTASPRKLLIRTLKKQLKMSRLTHAIISIIRRKTKMRAHLTRVRRKRRKKKETLKTMMLFPRWLRQ